MVHSGIDYVPPVELSREPAAIVDAAVTEDSLRFGEGVRQGAGGLADNFATAKIAVYNSRGIPSMSYTKPL